MTTPTIALTIPYLNQRAARTGDLLLVFEAQQGNEPAFERLYRLHVARVHTLAARMASPDAADDLTQDIFIRAWDKLGSFRGEATFSTWLHRLAVNVILDRRRGEQLARRWQDDSGQDIESQAGHRIPEGLRLDLERAIATLPDGAREIFVLYDIEGWSHEEIARQLGLAVGTSKSQLSRARAALRRVLDDG